MCKGLLSSLNVSESFPGARRNVLSALTAPTVPFTVTVITGLNVITSTGHVCAIRDSKGLTARTDSVHLVSTDSSVTDTAPVMPPTRSGEQM